MGVQAVEVLEIGEIMDVGDGKITRVVFFDAWADAYDAAAVPTSERGYASTK